MEWNARQHKMCYFFYVTKKSPKKTKKYPSKNVSELIAWMLLNGITQADLAHYIAVSPSSVGSWLQGVRRPRKSVAVLIEALTDGVVNAERLRGER